MHHVKIEINEVGDKPSFPELKGMVKDFEAYGFCILEHGTTGGETSCMVIGKDDAGKFCSVQFTRAMFQGMNAALTGAHKRFMEKPEQN